MADYKIVKYCWMCKKRFVVNKGETRIRLCVDCEKRASDDRKKRGQSED